MLLALHVIIPIIILVGIVAIIRHKIFSYLITSVGAITLAILSIVVFFARYNHGVLPAASQLVQTNDR